MPPVIAWQFLLHPQPVHVTASASDPFWNVDGPTWITAIATVGLLIGAAVTAVYAIRAFSVQTKEISDQADVLKIQSSRLELQERQFEDQRKINQKRDALLDKQIRESEQWARTFERQQAEMIDLGPGSIRTTIPGLVTDEDSRAWRVNIANGSSRPIRDAAGRIEAAPGDAPQQATLAAVYVEFTPGPLTPSGGSRRTLIEPPERPDIPLIKAGSTGVLIFPVGAKANPNVWFTVRFTDDAGLHWQIDHDLHLEKLDNRDW
jgi:hypothetical protein